MATDNLSYLEHILARKEARHLREHIAELPDSLEAWIACYLGATIVGVRDEGVAKKIARHLKRFQQFIDQRYGQERISMVLKRDVLRWRALLERSWPLLVRPPITTWPASPDFVPRAFSRQMIGNVIDYGT